MDVGHHRIQLRFREDSAPDKPTTVHDPRGVLYLSLRAPDRFAPDAAEHVARVARPRVVPMIVKV